MTDHDALVRAICEHPDDDTPRLIYADFLDETGEADRAAFVRAQVELARTPAWEPFAVMCRHRKGDWSETGEPFRGSLPELPAGWNVAWHERAFRRGLGWRVHIGSLHAWEELAPRLFEQTPVGELHLRAPATLDDWRRFAAADWVKRLRAVHLEAGSPVEPVRVLCGTPAATGITDLHFHVSNSPGLAILVADLLGTRLGGSLRGLHFRLGEYAGLEDLIEALTQGGRRFERLALELMTLTPDLVRRWCDRGGPRGLIELDLKDNYALGNDGVRELAAGLWEAGGALHTLGLAKVGLAAAGVKALAGCAGLTGVRKLDLGEGRMTTGAVRALAGSESLAGLRALTLANCHLGDEAVRQLVRARFWPNLVELDLRKNPVTDPGARHLLSAPIPSDLTALLLDGPGLSPAARAALRRHFGDRLILGQ
jgi:uncharacterized protein (TIGR02996 family)